MPSLVTIPDHKPVNREDWLMTLAKLVEPLFTGFNLGLYRISCSWPTKNATSKTSRRLGECHSPRSSKGGIHELCISPTIADSLEVAGVVCHEMAHVAAGIEAGHGKGFVLVTKHIGLTKGSPTTALPGIELENKLGNLIKLIGEYPHKAVEPITKLVKKQVSNIKLICEECECVVYISPKWLDSTGEPTCGCGGRMESYE